ncbi:S1C family serine protease [Paraliomyxa miuraensis]|uniref:S1C family serine protease n=1 Tax=Paraliomyxa miuraensis TaxID=376150 RepID=UPI00225894E5|nr:trypsin-like peptidase domain-containing protein [Paraliomyxa miuraensis]MCX4244726.1 S1C family serine protease [Paraliomyxa miuraensis]
MAPGPEPRPPSPLWLAAGTGLVGVSLGAAAVMMGWQAGVRHPHDPVVLADVAEPSRPLVEPAPSSTAPESAASTLVEAVAATRDAVVNLGTAGTLGAGVIVDPRGIVVTNYHVIADALVARPDPRGLAPTPAVIARFENGRELPATVLVADREEDLAILRLQSPTEGERFAAVTLGDSSSLEVGQEVFAIGNPFGLNHSVSRGIVAGLDRTEVIQGRNLPLIQLDASINVGNSGGPLFDLEGSLMGIVTMRRKDALGIAFAVPVDHVRGFLRAVSDPEAPRRSGAIGIEIRGRSAARPEDAAGGYTAWLEVLRVFDDGPAARAGLRTGDRVVEIRGKRLDGLAVESDAGDVLGLHLVSAVRSLFPGERLALTLVRGQAVQQVEVEVGAAPSDRQVDIDAEELLGLGLRPGSLEVASLPPGSPFMELGRAVVGMQVARVMGRSVTSADDLGGELVQLRELLRQGHGPLMVPVELRPSDGSSLIFRFVLVQ